MPAEAQSRLSLCRCQFIASSLFASFRVFRGHGFGLDDKPACRLSLVTSSPARTSVSKPKELTSGTRLGQFRNKLKQHPGAVRILTEGDSWLAFPLPSRPNIPDNLITAFGNRAAWLRLESIGDEVVEMLVGDQRNRLRKLLAQQQKVCK